MCIRDSSRIVKDPIIYYCHGLGNLLIWNSEHYRPKPGPKPSPSQAQARAQAEPKLGAEKIQKIKILKIKIRSAQNVGKVWISREKIFPGPFGAIWANFLRGPEKSKQKKKSTVFLGGPMGPIHPVWGPCCYPPEVGE